MRLSKPLLHPLYSSTSILLRKSYSKRMLATSQSDAYCHRSGKGRYTVSPFIPAKMEKAERNYEIHDKELLGIVTAFKVWHHQFHGSHFPIQVITDHNNLRYFMTTTKLNQRQVHWAEKLAQYDFRINYRPGKNGGKPDALSRRPEYAEGEGEENLKPLLSPEIFVSAINTLHPLLVKILRPGAKLPIRGLDLAAGIDVMANELATIPTNERMAINTGIAIATPPRTYARIAPRSSLAAKHSIDIGAGVIDQDYRGEIKVILINHSKYPYQVRPGDRIAQLILEKILLATPRETKVLDKTARGNRGFGSTAHDQNLAAKISSLKTLEFDEEFIQRVKKATQNAKVYQKDLENDLENQSGLLHFQKRLRIPHNEEIKREILESEHDHPTAGHFGQKKTLEIVSRNFYWPNMEETINEYVRTCDACQRNKSRRHAKYGLLQSLENPYTPWKSISVDLS